MGCFACMEYITINEERDTPVWAHPSLRFVIVRLFLTLRGV